MRVVLDTNVLVAGLRSKEGASAELFTRDEVIEALDVLAAKIEPAEPHFSWRPQLGDPDDEMVLEAAVNAGADAIVTFEVATFREAAASFGIDVLTPGALWVKVQP